jgi:hypothetical protein
MIIRKPLYNRWCRTCHTYHLMYICLRHTTFHATRQRPMDPMSYAHLRASYPPKCVQPRKKRNG